MVLKSREGQFKSNILNLLEQSGLRYFFKQMVKFVDTGDKCTFRI